MPNIVFMGTPDFAAVILRRLIEAGYPVTGVVTQPDRPRGRKKTPEMCEVKRAALALGLPVLQPEKVRRPEALEEIRKMNPDLIVVAAFGQILPKALLDLPRYGCLNVHASLLPAYRGAAPIQYAILDGLAETGVSIMRMDVGLDTGDIISVKKTPVLATDTGGSLFDRLADLGAALLVDTLPSVLDGTAVCTPQPAASPTPYAKMLTKEMGRINWQDSAEAIGRKVRAFSPWPSAYTTLSGKTFKVWAGFAGPCEETGITDLGERTDSAEPREEPGMAGTLPASDEAGAQGRDPQAYEAGRILRADAAGIAVRCGEGIYTITEVQIEGKKRMQAADFLRGARLEADRFE